MIAHTVWFRLRHPRDSAEETAFLEDAFALSAIPGVIDFQRHHEVSPKNDFDFGFTMSFADQAAYTSYDAHPVHVAFVENRWKVEVEDFLEIDHVPLGA